MFRLIIVTEDNAEVRKLHAELSKWGFSCSITSDAAKVLANSYRPDLVILATNGRTESPETKGLVQRIKQERGLPVIALIPRRAMNTLDDEFGLDDFVITPWETDEVVARIKRTMHLASQAKNDLIKCGDLVIDPAKCEVRLGCRVVSLTFKEYELLRFLATNRGKVFTRDALLNQVWGYDYFGGDRTVDVHVRRLRSKIEDQGRTFIDTVRNIGYRFREDL